MNSSIDCKNHENSLKLTISMLISDVFVEKMNGRSDFGWKGVVKGQKLIFYTILHFIIMQTCQLFGLKLVILERLWPDSTYETSVSELLEV